MAPVSRAQGYKNAVGKEGPAIEFAQQFLRSVLNLESSVITDQADNYSRGDLVVDSSGLTIEVKGQPIHPKKFKQNFVEVFEAPAYSANPSHSRGLEHLAALLGLSVEALAALRFRLPKTEGDFPVGQPPFVSVSIQSFFGSSCVIYAGVTTGYIYLYQSDELVELVKSAVRSDGFGRGFGNSNEVTYAVLVPNAAWRWHRGAAGQWAWAGTGDENAAVSAARQLLSGSGT